MTKFIRDLIESITIGVIVGVIGFLGITEYRNIKQQIAMNQKITQSLINNQDKSIDNIYFALSIMDMTDNIILKTIQDLNRKIDNIPNQIKIDKIKLEQKLKQVNVMIINATLGAEGSGVTLKYKNKFYILSAGHMAENDTGELWLKENGQLICKLEIVKYDYTTHEEEDYTQGTDLILLRPIDLNIVPRVYVELADTEPITGTEVYVVGNPMTIEDVISDGRVIVYKNNFMYYLDHTYFGNSGGGVYTKEGKLVGIVSHMYNLKPAEGYPDYIINGAVRLEVIYQFLEDVN